jgi:hypothetical protein
MEKYAARPLCGQVADHDRESERLVAVSIAHR